RSAELDNSAQRVASAGADAPRHREQDAMEPDRSTQPGLGEGTHPATSSQEAQPGAPREDAADGGANSQLTFEHPGTAVPGTATDASPATPSGAGPAGDDQHDDGQRGDIQRVESHQGGDG